MDSRQEWSFAGHRAWFEPLHNILWAEFRGPVDVDSVRWSVSLYREMGQRQPIYLIADIKGARHTPEARRHLVENVRPEWFRGVVYLSSSPDQQAVSTGFMLALRKIGGPTYDFVYLDTAEQARAWVEQHAARRKPGP